MSFVSRASLRTQRGGLTILMALVLVGVMGAATFSLSRNAIRELSMAGTIVQGNKAAATADAGLDWVIVWAQGAVNRKAFDDATPSAKGVVLLGEINKAINPATRQPYVQIASGADPAMRLDRGGAAKTIQDFDIELRFLGTFDSTSDGGNSDNSGASGGTVPPATTKESLWRVLSTGRATPENAQTYQSQRELVATLPL